MLYFATAMYGEAKPIISFFHMKKSELITKFQFYQSDHAYLIITNTGPMHAAIAITHLLTILPPDAESFLINIGVCGTNKPNKIGTLFLCNKITEAHTLHTYYPDLLYKHPFKENQITTYSYVNRSQDSNSDELVDMEASGIYQAASVFLSPHQIILAKIPSDCMDDSNINNSFVTNLISNQIPIFMDWILSLYNAVCNKNIEQVSFVQFSFEELQLIKKICDCYHFSKSMENILKQYLIFYKVSTKNMGESLSYLLNKITYVVGKEKGTKEEGKKYLEELKYAIL